MTTYSNAYRGSNAKQIVGFVVQIAKYEDDYACLDCVGHDVSHTSKDEIAVIREDCSPTSKCFYCGKILAS